MSERPNFYLLLDLDPEIDDWPTIERRIKDKQREWSADRQGNPKKRRIAESSLARIKEITGALTALSSSVDAVSHAQPDPLRPRHDCLIVALQSPTAIRH